MVFSLYIAAFRTYATFLLLTFVSLSFKFFVITCCCFPNLNSVTANCCQSLSVWYKLLHSKSEITLLLTAVKICLFATSCYFPNLWNNANGNCCQSKIFLNTCCCFSNCSWLFKAWKCICCSHEIIRFCTKYINLGYIYTSLKSSATTKFVLAKILLLRWLYCVLS